MKKLKSFLKKNTAKFFFAFAAIFLAFSSCSKKNAAEIPLDFSDPLALAPDIRWAVVNAPYAAFKKEAAWEAQSAGYCKRGEYFAILATSTIFFEEKSELWYRFEGGWLPESAVLVFSNKLRAAKAAAAMK